jgi:hypothetical protein
VIGVDQTRVFKRILESKPEGKKKSEMAQVQMAGRYRTLFTKAGTKQMEVNPLKHSG